MSPKFRLFMAATVTLLLACGSDDVTGPARVQGSYKLDQVNGAVLPFLAEESGAARLEVIAGALSLAANGNYAAEVTTRFTDGNTSFNTTHQSTGTFTAAGQQVTFSEAGTGAKYSGVLAGDRLTALREGVTLGFVKQ